jgi:hypothetical protein
LPEFQLNISSTLALEQIFHFEAFLPRSDKTFEVPSNGVIKDTFKLKFCDGGLVYKPAVYTDHLMVIPITER